MTEEELKDALRRYATERFPGWTLAAVSVRIGKLGDSPEEVLIVKPEPLLVAAPSGE